MVRLGESHDGAEKTVGTEEPVGNEPTGVSCPLCGGVLWESERPEELVCRIGHSFESLEEVENAQTAALENLLWAAERALRERAIVLRRLAHRVSDDSYSGRTFQREAQAAGKNAELLRGMLERNTARKAERAESHESLT